MKLMNTCFHAIFPLPAMVNLALLTPLILCFIGSLIQYYKMNPSGKGIMHTLEKMNRRGIKFIVHAENQVFKLKNIQFNYQIISGDKEKLNPEYLEYLDPVSEDRSPLSIEKHLMGQRELHLYTDHTILKTNRISFTASQIKGIHVYEPRAQKLAAIRNVWEIILPIVTIMGAILVVCSLTWNAIRTF